LSLTELLVASTIMVLIAGGMGSLAMTAHEANSYSRGRLVAAQHARVALDRIEQTIDQAVASEQFPVCLIVTEQIGSEELPQTLVVWSPEANAVEPAGLPRVNELAIFAPDPAQPGRLVEFRSPSDSSVTPAPSDLTAWRTLTDGIKSSQTSQKVTLTDRLRTAPLSGQWSPALTSSELRGVVRFRRVMTPTDQQWAQYKSALRTWNAIDWPLDSFRTTSGTRAVACQTELQIVSGDMASAAATAVPFFGSTLRTYELAR
jgi:hypothetical protein